ncbi:MAG TPA: radical SAM protein [Candidatus Omnitrophota bacterium]|nr:radical SAM protein [Candidatus Omnitrophota bacterium]HPS19562.1 radical SAM protein [Candidatus Omnitrophota bacterium]
MYISFLNKIMRSAQKKHAGRLFYFPNKISIEPGNICNLRCPLCPTNDPDNADIKKGMMSLGDFKIIFDKISPFVKTIDLFNWGEPFLNKEIGDMVRYARERKPGIRVFIDSNLNIINDGQIDAIVRYGLDVLKVSCDGVSQAVYEKYRRGGNVNDVLENIKRIIRKKEELKIDKPRIIWKYLVFKHNIHEVNEARRMAGELGIDLEASGMRINCGKEIFETVEESVSRDAEWIPSGTEYDNYKDLGKKKDTCEKPWKTMTINWDGSVTPCGAIYDCEKYNFGNLIKESFDAVWNGKMSRTARGVIADKCDAPGTICSICKKNGYQFF